MRSSGVTPAPARERLLGPGDRGVDVLGVRPARPPPSARPSPARRPRSSRRRSPAATPARVASTNERTITLLRDSSSACQRTPRQKVRSGQLDRLDDPVGRPSAPRPRAPRRAPPRPGGGGSEPRSARRRPRAPRASRARARPRGRRTARGVQVRRGARGAAGPGRRPGRRSGSPSRGRCPGAAGRERSPPAERDLDTRRARAACSVVCSSAASP